VTNQAGVAIGKKSLQSCIKEQEYTLVLLPDMQEIYRKTMVKAPVFQAGDETE
jgi:hypothetical protein